MKKETPQPEITNPILIETATPKIFIKILGRQKGT